MLRNRDGKLVFEVYSGKYLYNICFEVFFFYSVIYYYLMFIFIFNKIENVFYDKECVCMDLLNKGNFFFIM